MEPQTNPATVKRAILAYFIIVAAVSVYLIIYGVVYSNGTGVLEVKTNTAEAALSVSQADHQASIIGTGSTKVRLKPGVYQLVAVSSGNQVTQTVLIVKHEKTSKTLSLTGRTETPSVLSIDFKNTNALKDSGLSSPQLTSFEQDVFDYKSSAKEVVVDDSSISPGPRDPNDPNAPFTLNFDITIDSSRHKVTLTYKDNINVTTQFYDSDSNLLYDSATNQGE